MNKDFIFHLLHLYIIKYNWLNNKIGPHHHRNLNLKFLHVFHNNLVFANGFLLCLLNMTRKEHLLLR